MFSERTQGHGIIFVGDHLPGQPIKDSITEGDSVMLKIDEERVLVRNIESIAHGKYRGTIYGFEPSFAVEYEGFSIGQQIEFSEKHIFRCSCA